ncbi:hypothetical protein ACFPJ1_40795 [Kribbella qitaiheensis]|uniref:hypothetical protein n=1 Tax=Kribbella qitaiheensis TaxID=1544730 RepID=UPI003606CD4C
MEILVVVAIMSVIVKRGAEDIIHTARGGTPPRYAAASARRKSGAAGRYWGQLWDDAWDDLSQRHAAKKAGRSSSPAPASASRPRGAATQFFAGLGQDAGRGIRRSWDRGWVRADERRRARATRPRPGQVTVPGQVVPNAPSRPQDEDRPAPDPHVVPTEDGADLRFGDDPTDPTGVRGCPECHGTSVVDGEICLSCRDRQEQRNQHHEDQTAPDYPPDYVPDYVPDNQTTTPLASTTTQEGTTMTTTIPTDTEIIGLDPAIDYCGTTVQACNAMVHSLEQTEAAIIAGGVSGVATAAFANARELFGQIASIMGGAGQEFIAHKRVQEAYDATPGAGTKEFLTAGR